MSVSVCDVCVCVCVCVCECDCIIVCMYRGRVGVLDGGWGASGDMSAFACMSVSQKS